MRKLSAQTTSQPINMVGSSIFGRYPKISNEQTFNMIISDNTLVPYAGYLNVQQILSNGMGRGGFSSRRWGKMIVVVNSNVYAVSSNIFFTQIGTLLTTSGNVFIDENQVYQIAICDQENLYIYNWNTGVFQMLTLDFQPGYVCYQDSRFICPDLQTSQWRLSDVDDNTSFPNQAQNVGALQTKPDNVLAVIRAPGLGNLIFVFGSTVTEMWYDTGGTLFPYQKSSSIDIDYGTFNAATIAFSDTVVAWLGTNERSGPIILYSSGGSINKISTDGIDFLLASLTDPSDSFAFFFKQDGHLFYQITFPTDNLSLTYDFSTEKFFTVCDENLNYHIAKYVMYFNNYYYFVTPNDGNLYQFSSHLTNYNYGNGNIFMIPRIRIPANIRQPDASRFLLQNVPLVMEQGTDPFYDQSTETTYFPRVSLSLSKNGGYTFSSEYSLPMYTLGKYANRFIFWNLGTANDFVLQFRFMSLWRFVIKDSMANVYQ